MFENFWKSTHVYYEIIRVLSSKLTKRGLCLKDRLLVSATSTDQLGEAATSRYSVHTDDPWSVLVYQVVWSVLRTRANTDFTFKKSQP